jgi:integrase
MATGKFRVRTSNEWNTIFYRFKQGDTFDFEISTGIKIPNKRWSDTKQMVLATIDVDFKGINEKLKELDSFVQKEFNNNIITENIINSKWLKEKINICFNRETKNVEIDDKLFLTNFILTYIEESRTKKTKKNTTVKPRTIQHYQTTLNKIVAFENHSGKRVKFANLSIKFHTQFVAFLEDEQKLNPNTIGGYIDDLKLFLNNADKRGFEFPNDYKLNEFYSPTNKTKDIYLKEPEIDLIYNTHFEQESLVNARDWFVIGLRTGLRVSDLLKLTKDCLDDGFIERETIKTEYPVIIPIHEQVQNILDKRNGNFPRTISDQRFNDYIKIIAKTAGLNEVVDGAKLTPVEVTENGKTKTIHRKTYGKFPKYELVSSHICRRSFASNLYGKIETLTIMKITGHQTESQFLKYIKITPKEYAQKLKAYWKNISLQTQTNNHVL